MYKSLKIEGFRRFQSLEIGELARVNLLVGRNNSGKTSVLEAISLLASPSSLRETALRRNEMILVPEDPEADIRNSDEIDLSCLFHDYSPRSGVIKLVGSGSWRHSLEARIASDPDFCLVFALDGIEADPIEISQQLGLALWSRDTPAGMPRAPAFPKREAEGNIPRVLVETQGYTASRLAFDLGRVLLTPEEELVLEALRLIDPSIQRIAALADFQRPRVTPLRSHIFVVCEGRPRVPLGNMGDGVWRLLMLALSLVKAAKGILLVDEIDTGLHYTVLEGMWRLVLRTASKLDVQVFATTHSDDCWKALANVLEAEEGALDEAVSLHRLEGGRAKSVVFPGNRIRIAAANEIEVR